MRLFERPHCSFSSFNWARSASQRSRASRRRGQRRSRCRSANSRWTTGLNVILHRDASVPVVAVNVWYHVGSANERPGRTGFAHLFEHLMFEGSKNVAEGEFDTLLEAAGGEQQRLDERRPHQLHHRRAGERARARAVPRVRPHGVSARHDDARARRRPARRRQERAPAELREPAVRHGRRSSSTRCLWPAGHPYHWPTIGYMEDLTAASYEDVVQFFKTYYAPNNASLVVAGDIDFDDAQALVEKWFGEIPRGAEVRARRAAARAADGRDSASTLTDRVRLPRLYLAWLTPRQFAPGDAALDVLAAVLADGKNSRLYKRLVYDTQMAQDVTAYQGSARARQLVPDRRDGAARAHGRGAATPSSTRRSRACSASRPTAREVERALNQIEASFYRGMERVGGFGGKADQLNAYFAAGGGPDFFAEDLARYTALTPPTCRPPRSSGCRRDAARRARRRAGGSAMRRRLRLAASCSRCRRCWPRSSRPIASQPPALGPPARLDAAASRRAHELRTASTSGSSSRTRCRSCRSNLVVHAGSGDDPDGEFGLASLTAAMLDEGAGTRSALEIADAVEFLGAELGTTSSFDASAVRLNVPARALERSAADHGRRRARPTFPADELERLRQERLTALLQARDDPAAVAAPAFARVVYGDEHRYGTSAVGTTATLAAFTAAAAACVSCGDVPAEQRDADRRRRRHRRRRCCRCSSARSARGRRGRAAARAAGAAAPQLAAREVDDRRHARRRAVADPHRLGRRRALDAGLLRAASAEHRARRLVHVALEPESARGARLRVRRELAVRHAACAGAVRRRRRRPDRQDGGVVDGILQRARGDSRADRRGRAREGQELLGAGLPGRLRDDRRSRRPPRGARDLRLAGDVSTPTTRPRSAPSRPRTCSEPRPRTFSPTSSRSWSSGDRQSIGPAFARSTWVPCA